MNRLHSSPSRTAANRSRFGSWLTLAILVVGMLLMVRTQPPLLAASLTPTQLAAASERENARALSQVVYHPSYLQPSAQQDPCCLISPSVAAQLVRQVLAKLPGIGDVAVNEAAGTLTVNYDPAQVQEEEITTVLTEEYFLP